MIGRRSFITGLVSLVAAPAIVRAGSLMPVKVIEPYGVGPMMHAIELLHAERLVNPPWIGIDLDACIGDIIKIMGVPSRYLRSYP